MDDSKLDSSNEQRMVNILLHGSTAAKREVLSELIILEKDDVLETVLLSMTDAEYYLVVPSC